MVVLVVPSPSISSQFVSSSLPFPSRFDIALPHVVDAQTSAAVLDNEDAQKLAAARTHIDGAVLDDEVARGTQKGFTNEAVKPCFWIPTTHIRASLQLTSVHPPHSLFIEICVVGA